MKNQRKRKEKRMYCKLIDAIETPQTLNLAESKVVNGKRIAVYKPRRFLPGKKYEVPDDPVFIQSLKNCKQKVKYTPETEATLKECGSSYEVVYCKSCGGRVRKIEYHVIEVVEE